MLLRLLDFGRFCYFDFGFVECCGGYLLVFGIWFACLVSFVVCFGFYWCLVDCSCFGLLCIFYLVIVLLSVVCLCLMVFVLAYYVADVYDLFK